MAVYIAQRLETTIVPYGNKETFSFQVKGLNNAWYGPLAVKVLNENKNWVTPIQIYVLNESKIWVSQIN